MNYTKSKYNSKARSSLLKGAGEIYKAVSKTLGPRGRNIVIHKDHHTRILQDGVKVATSVMPKDSNLSAGAEILRQASQQQVDKVGDGTTVAVILGYAIAKEALKVVESGINPMSLKSSLEKGGNLLVEEIEKLSKPIKTKQEKVRVATISSKDPELGSLIGETYHEGGINAVITADQVSGPVTFIDHQEGMQIDSGWKAEYFITSPRNMTATVNDAYILITDYKLDDIHQMIPLLNNLVGENKKTNIVVIAEDIEGNVLATLIKNKIGPFPQGQVPLNTLAIKASSYQMEEHLQDLATFTGGKFISSNARMDIKKVTIDDLGTAKRVTSTRDATIIVGGGGESKMVKDRIEAVKDQINEETNEFKKEKLKERLSKLSGGVYTIKVGGATEVEAEEKTERVDDAIKATRAAIEEGIVPGGEIVYLKARDVLKAENESEDYAYRILYKALEKPFNKLVSNAGMDSGEIRARVNIDKGEGMNVSTGEICDLVKEGILDPAKVSKEAIKNAISVATAIITSDGIITLHEKK